MATKKTSSNPVNSNASGAKKEHHGTKNLVKIDSTEKAKELGAKGGKASGVAKRKKKALKELALLLLDAEPNKLTATQKKKLEKLGISDEVIDNRTLMLGSIMSNATLGDLKSAEKILDIAGEHTARQSIDISSSGKLGSLVDSIDKVKDGTQ